eukprot:SAG22_NODE_18601_length_284_cov_1.102703_1_plen_35_part_01
MENRPLLLAKAPRTVLHTLLYEYTPRNSDFGSRLG